MVDLVIRNGKIVFPDLTLKGSIAIESGKIVSIGRDPNVPKSEEVIDAEGSYVLPGGVDTHNHTHMETSYAASKGVSWGGTTTILNFTRASFQEVDDYLALTKSYVVDHSFHVIPDNLTPDRPTALDDIKKWIDWGIPSFKLFMVYEDPADVNTIYNTFLKCREHGGLPMLHAENRSMVEYNREKTVREGNTEPIYHALTRPPISEAEAVNMAIYLANSLGVPYMNMHLTIKEGVEMIGEARKKGHLIYGETCPQYLCKTQDDLAGPMGLYLICTPPFRPPEHVEALWDGLRSGAMSVVGSDHVGLTKEVKEEASDFAQVPNGCPGHEFRLAVLWSEGVMKNRISVNRLSEVFSTNAAKIYGLYPRKGIIQVGSDADLTIINPKKQMVATQEELEKLGIAESDWSPYDGMEFNGWPSHTILRGKILWDDGEFKGEEGFGEFHKRRLSPDLFNKLVA